MENINLHYARAARSDEFYTQLCDIERELKHYKDFFKGKIVLCNCDDPFESNFFKYFALSFNELGLKKLITTCYASSPVMYREFTFFGEKNEPTYRADDRKPYYIEIDEVRDLNFDGAVDLDDVRRMLQMARYKPTTLKGDGDFRSEECIKLLDEADVVVTNPPFSLFREYVQLLKEHEKKFIILGNQNAITYRDVFSLFRENLLWYGVSIHSGDVKFNVPEAYPLEAATCGIDENNNHFICVKGIRWFTNIEHSLRHEKLYLGKRYIPENYPKYDNYNAINVDATADIPYDYSGIMGVPITFLDKYCPDQFEILGMCSSAGYNEKIVGIPFCGKKDARPMVNGKVKYARLFIRRIDI